MGEGQAPDYAHTAYVTDETGAIFHPSEFAIVVVEPGSEIGIELTRLFTFPGALLLVPQSARSAWEGSGFTPPPVANIPTTFVEAPAPGLPGTDLVDPEPSVWLVLVSTLAVGGVFWLLLRRGSESESPDTSVGVEGLEPPTPAL